MRINWRDTAAGFATLADTSSGQVLSRSTLESEPFGWLKSQELVERGRALSLLRCGECRVHHTIETDDDGHFMTCAGGMERLSPDQITRWRCNWLRLGNFLNQSARLEGTAKTILSDCLLELGLLGKPSNGQIVLLARGLGHPDKRKAVFNRLSEGASWAGGILITATRFYGTGELPNRMKQVWLALPDGARVRNSTSRSSPLGMDGVDVRTAGGLIIVPPSERAGGAYGWLHRQATLPVAPAGLVTALTSTPETQLTAPPQPFAGGPLSPYAEAVLQRELDVVANCPRGGRNDALFKASARLAGLHAGGALPDGRTRLEDAASRAGLIRDDGLPAVRATIASGWARGLHPPPPAPCRRGADNVI